jgi:hypothetical protein
VTNLFLLELAIVAFWAVWFALVFLTNLFSALKAAGALGPEWKFASTNFEAVKKAVSIHSPPPWIANVLFLGVVVWQLTAASLFARAFLASIAPGALDMDAIDAAFTAGIGLWAAFMIADEITLKYAYEQSHELLFIAQVACLVALHVLPS